MRSLSVKLLNCNWVFFGGGEGGKLECLGERFPPTPPSRLNPEGSSVMCFCKYVLSEKEYDDHYDHS